MLVKKHKSARLSPYSNLFFQLGLILTLIVIYIALEWKSFDRIVNEFDQAIFQTEEIEDIPITERIIEVKPPPPPPPAPEKIEIVSDEQEIIETVLESTETDEGEAIIIDNINLDDIDEIIEEEIIEMEVPFAIIEEPPVFPGCTGTKAQKKKCLQEKIKEHVSKNFKIAIAQDLGLSTGKKKVYVLFRIDKYGNIVNVKARGPHKRLEKEAIRVIKLLPQMTPGKQRTIPVKVSYTLPITLVVLDR